MKSSALKRFLKAMSGVPVLTIVQAGVGYGREIASLTEAFPEARLYGFDPSPGFAWHWKHKAVYPGQYVQAGLGSKAETAKLFHRYRRAEASSMFPRSEDHRFDLVPVIPLDTVLPLIDPIPKSLLWMDCEGSELGVVAGATRFLKAMNYVVAEIAYVPERSYPEPRSVMAAIKRHGFRVMERLSRCDYLFRRVGD